MNTTTTGSRSRSLITQTRNNTTLWIGHLQSDPTDHMAGQTFICPSDGLVDNIQVYSAAVQYPGELTLTLHEFNPANRSWGPAIGESRLDVEAKDDERWIRFDLPPVPLREGMHYGFRLYANNAMVALGEAATGIEQPFTFGHEWHGDSNDRQGQFFSYFSLAFKVELCA